jgi:hypothetical protein
MRVYEHVYAVLFAFDKQAAQVRKVFLIVCARLLVLDSLPRQIPADQIAADRLQARKMLVSLVFGKRAPRKRYAARIKVSRKARLAVRCKRRLCARKVYASEHSLPSVLVNNSPVFAKKARYFHIYFLKK